MLYSLEEIYPGKLLDGVKMSNMLYRLKNKSKQTQKLDDNSQNLLLLYNNLDFVYTFNLLPHEDRNMQ